MGRVPRWSSRVALTLLLTGFLLCRLASLFVLVFPCVGIARICRECKGWTWGNFPLSKRAGNGVATCNRDMRPATSRHADPLLFPSQHPWSRHGDTRRSSPPESRQDTTAISGEIFPKNGGGTVRPYQVGKPQHRTYAGSGQSSGEATSTKKKRKGSAQIP